MKRPSSSLVHVLPRLKRDQLCDAFTLIEIIIAASIGAMILVAVYGVFQQVIKTRDYATQRINETRLRARAANIIRNDLRNALFSGGVLASTMEGGAQNQKSRFPGYLRFTNTTGKNSPDEAYGDVQQVEYYMTDGSNATTSASAGNFVRALTRDLLATVQNNADEQQILANVLSFDVSFYAGQDWQDSWQMTDGSSARPSAIRVRVQQAGASEHIAQPPPLEILVPLTTQSLITSANASASVTPTPTPAITPPPTPTPAPTSSPQPSPSASSGARTPAPSRSR